MQLRFISSLTPEDEERLAPGLLVAVRALLAQVPIAYTLRIETEGGTVLHHHQAPQECVTVPAATSVL